MSRGFWLGALLALVMFSACSEGGQDAWTPQPQVWRDMTVRVESRPVVPRNGMNEFLVLVDRKRRGFISDLLVKVRTDHCQWQQAMPDGALGVYRRALPVEDARHDHLYVLLQYHGERGELVFPISIDTEGEKH